MVLAVWTMTTRRMGRTAQQATSSLSVDCDDVWREWSGAAGRAPNMEPRPTLPSASALKRGGTSHMGAYPGMPSVITIVSSLICS